MPVALIKNKLKKLFYDPYKIIARHSNIVIDPSTIILKTTMFNIHESNKLTIGKESMVACYFHFEPGNGVISVGDRTFINERTSLIARTGIVIGNDVTISFDCIVYDHNAHSMNWIDRRNDILLQNRSHRNGQPITAGKNWDIVKSKPVTIQDKAWIGFECVILAGVTVGEGSIVGARSVVREDIPPWSVAIGNPAVVVKTIRS